MSLNPNPDPNPPPPPNPNPNPPQRIHTHHARGPAAPHDLRRQRRLLPAYEGTLTLALILTLTLTLPAHEGAAMRP